MRRSGRQGLALLWLSLAFACSSRAPYRLHEGSYPSCPGLMPLQVVEPWEESTHHESPVCVLTFDYSYMSQHQIRLWITEPEGGKAWAYVDTLNREDEITLSQSEEITPAESHWFQTLCEQVLQVPLDPESPEPCVRRVRDGIHFAVGRPERLSKQNASVSSWRWGETWRVPPDTDLYELHEAARALVGLVSAPKELKDSYWIQLHQIIFLTQHYQRSNTSLDLCTDRWGQCPRSAKAPAFE